MKIGVMLRHLTQHGGGVLVYTTNLLRHMFELNTSHEFVLMYNDPSLVGTFPDWERVREVAVGASNKFLWDQWSVRRVEKQEKLDLIFNPKYSLPLTAKCPTVFVCHGLDWFVMPWGSRFLDRLSHRYLIPRYAKKADRIIAVSDTTRGHVIDYLGVEGDRVQTVYLGVDETFRETIPLDRLEEIRSRFQLPKRFFLYCGQIYPPKNFGRLLRAYAQVGPQLGISLVVAGTHTWLCQHEFDLVDQLGISSWVVQPGWIDRQTLPAFYALAEGLLLPSLYEACPSPILEAMSIGCPIVTSNRYGTQELAGPAACLVDPESVESIADGLRQITLNLDLRRDLIQAGRRRAANFTWRKCAQETIAVLEKAAG